MRLENYKEMNPIPFCAFRGVSLISVSNFDMRDSSVPIRARNAPK